MNELDGKEAQELSKEKSTSMQQTVAKSRTIVKMTVLVADLF